MNPLRRMSPKMAVIEATNLASTFLAQKDSRGFFGELGDATPDPIETEKLGKVPRYWNSLVRWSKDGSELDGPAIILIDLRESKCQWA